MPILKEKPKRVGSNPSLHQLPKRRLPRAPFQQNTPLLEAGGRLDALRARPHLAAPGDVELDAHAARRLQASAGARLTPETGAAEEAAKTRRPRRGEFWDLGLRLDQVREK